MPNTMARKWPKAACSMRPSRSRSEQKPLPPRGSASETTFFSAHGLKDGTDVHRDKVYTVVGVFGATGSVIDQLLLTSIESVWGVHADIEGADQEITAVLLKKKNPLAILTLPNLLRDTPMQVALPAIEMNRLTQQFGIGLSTLRAVALLIMGLSFVSVFIALFASLRDRRYELALMRTMGAPPAACSPSCCTRASG